MKKYINTVSFAKISVLFFMLFTTLVNAQEALPDAPDDTAAAPIDNYVMVLALIGLALAFIKIRASYKQNTELNQ